MASTMAIFSHIYNSPITRTKGLDANPRNCFRVNVPQKPQSAHCIKTFSLLSTLNSDATIRSNGVFHSRIVSKAAASVSGLSSDSVEEPETKVKFLTSQSLPGCSSALSLLGTGYREKVFAIIGVKVYAAGLYANPSIFSELDGYRGSSADKIQNDSSIFDAIFQAPLEKSLNIVLVRDVDGKTFWDALDGAISPRIKSSTATDELALSKFRENFQGRPLKKGTNIFLTWMDKTKILICVSSDGKPTSVDATIESLNVASALFDVFLGKNPVSPSLKASVSKGLVSALSN